MIEIDMSDPWKQEILAIAVCNVLGEVGRNQIGMGFKDSVKDYLKKKYNYNIEYTLDELGRVSGLKIHTDEVFFILKHS